MDLNIEQLNILCDWSTDSTIRSCFRDSFKPVILIQSQLENDVSMNNRIIGELDENLSNKNDISTAINIALKQVGFLFLLLDDDNIHKLDTSDLTEQVDLIQNIQPSSSLILYTLLDRQINFIKMIEIRIKYEAYSSRILEYKYHGEQIAKNSDLTINLNKANHMVTHFINNENLKTRFITQYEKCWKTNRKTMAVKLAQHHKEKLARNKKRKNKKKRNVNSVICK
ncbi:10695_t:CDS:2, partial [Funneliformis geosporum]